MDLHLSLTPEQGQIVKALATKQGKSLEEYAIDQILSPPPHIQQEEETEDEKAAWAEFETLILKRVEAAAKPGGITNKSFRQATEEFLKSKDAL